MIDAFLEEFRACTCPTIKPELKGVGALVCWGLWKAVTIFPAEIFGVADKIGSLEAGKRADVIVTDGDPLEITTQVKRLFIGGEDISLETNQTLLWEKFRARP